MTARKCTKRIRNVYVIGYALIRTFSACSLVIKILMFGTCSALGNVYRVGSWRKVKVRHNVVLRDLLGKPRHYSASTLFVNHRLNNRVFIVRAIIHSFMRRLLRSADTLVNTVTRGAAEGYSYTWHDFDIKLCERSW